MTNAAAGSEFKAYKFAEFADPQGTALTVSKVRVNTVDADRDVGPVPFAIAGASSRNHLSGRPA
ncbi:hypothetical protein AB4920_10315 [Bifidobacterium dentium]|uniref:hypothetical protein n=1 Tax=Bifidobacterium dentium TaxID=1689 RepID=UPI003D172D43